MSQNFWIEEYLRPAFVSDAAWQKVRDHLFLEISDPLEGVPDYLTDTITRLESMGFTNVTMLTALKFQVEQILDLGSLQERTNIGSLGQGWSSLADVRLQISETGAKTISGLVSIDALYSLNASASAQYIASVSLGKVVGQDGSMTKDGVMLRPVFTSSNTSSNGFSLITTLAGYEAIASSGDKFVFDADGKFLSFVTNQGHEIDVIYDLEGRIARYENGFGEHLEFSYDVSGKLISAEDNNGRIISYAYDLGGALVNIEDNAGETDFTYDIEGNLLTAQREDGTEIAFTYDSVGRIATQTVGGILYESYAYDNTGGITITDALSEDIFVQLGPKGVLASTENSQGQTFSISADAATNSGSVALSGGHTLGFTYDSSNRITSLTDANNNTIHFDYDQEAGNLITFTDAGGSERQFAYDGTGRMVEATWADNTSLLFSYDVNGNILEHTNRRGQTVEYEYDINGRTTSISDSASGTLESVLKLKISGQPSRHKLNHGGVNEGQSGFRETLKIL